MIISLDELNKFRLLFIHLVVDVSAQGGCTVTPIKPTTLTAAGGVLASGTVNVMIKCNCTDDNGTVVDPVRWYDPDGTRLLVNAHGDYVAGTPYYKREPDNANIALVIPTFNDSYVGTYTCGGKRMGVRLSHLMLLLTLLLVVS